MKLPAAILRYKLHHLPVWIAIACVWCYLRYTDYPTLAQAWTISIIKTADLALMVYLANYLLIPKLLYAKKYGWFAAAYLSMITASSIGKLYLTAAILQVDAISWPDDLKLRIYNNFIPHFFLVTAGVAFKLLLDHNRIQKRLAEVAREKAETELNFLKSQINPHFLFNSLNAVYFLIDKNNTEARQALHQFSEMLRYQLYEVRDEKLPIEKEVGYLKDYIHLQRLRRDEHCAVELRVGADMAGFSIEPLLLIPFLENAFKHLSHYGNGQANRIEIGLHRQNGDMNFSIRNTTEGRAVHLERQGGIGLGNVKRRLELLYPQKHTLSIDEKEGWFDVRLQIKIDC